ncbi:MAG: sulfatase-like hydrolase/transferase [Verrucomicrobiales bacterium]|nr:sulfatase-like hydrolase/transferase [Verrucomicrobiales bacterium]
MRTFLSIVIAVGWSTLCSAADKPNILFIFADDQCFETIGAFDRTDIETPNLDKLVERGTTFTHTYNMGSWSGAVCVASRHMLNTGAFVWKAEQISQKLNGGSGKKGKSKGAAEPENPWPDFQKEELMWSQLMSGAGYDTYFTGKWHVRAKPEAVFDVAKNVRAGMPNQTPEGYNRPIDGQPDPWDPSDPKFEGFWKGGKHWSEVVADDAEKFLSMAKKKEDPFFMYIAFNAPHDPRQSPKEFVDRYPLDRIAMPENFLPEYPYKDQIDCSAGLRDEKLAPFPRTENAVKVNRQEYYAIITHMDEQIGRILEALEQSGKQDNTYIFFTADHGLAVGRHGLMGKQNLFDHSIRVPMMAVGPGIAAGKKNSSPVYLQDIMATALDLGGAEKPEHVQFQSLKPVWEGKSDGYDAIYGGYLQGQRCVVKGHYKLLLFPRVPKAQLFNLKEDPFEMNDIYEDNQSRAKEMFADLLALQKETGDKLDITTAFPELK